jgi:putative acetyltransferase
MDTAIVLRPYRTNEAEKLLEMYYNTVHTINKQHYNTQQLDAWVPSATANLSSWKDRFLANKTWVALKHDEVVGFGNLEHQCTTIGMLYVHKDYQRQGVATLLLQKLESLLIDGGIRKAIAEVSLTARPFFERQGYLWVRDNHKLLRGVNFFNFIMEKEL